MNNQETLENKLTHAYREFSSCHGLMQAAWSKEIERLKRLIELSERGKQKRA